MVFMYSPFGGYSFAHLRMKDFDFVFADKRICLLLRSNRTTNVSLCKCALPQLVRWGYYTTDQLRNHSVDIVFAHIFGYNRENYMIRE